MTRTYAKLVLERLADELGKERVTAFEQCRDDMERAALALEKACREAGAEGRPGWAREAAAGLVRYRWRYVHGWETRDEAEEFPPEGLAEWARAQGATRGELALLDVLQVCAMSREEMGEGFLAYLRDRKERHELMAGGVVVASIVADAGNIRFRVDGGEERTIPNGYGDGWFHAYARKGEATGRGVLVEARESLELAGNDCGAVWPSMTLPAGRWEILADNGHAEVTLVG